MQYIFGRLLNNILFLLSKTSRLSYFVTIILDQFLSWLCRSNNLSKFLGFAILWSIAFLMKVSAVLYPSFKEHLRKNNIIAIIKTNDHALARTFIFHDSRITSRHGTHPDPDVVISYHSAALAVKLLVPWRNQLEQINAMKNFKIGIEGPDELTYWLTETLSMMLTAGMEYGKEIKNGVKRYTSNTNGGPVFVDVKEGRILRIIPIEFDRTDAKPWVIRARGKRFSPPRKTTISPHTLAWKSMVYSPDRLLYPLKRIDFDPKGDRNCENRGSSGYERISWDDALDIVSSEIKRVKREHGPGAIMNGSGSHHTWGYLGYWLSVRMRFFNSIGWTPVVHNPDSWEGS